MLNSSQIKLIQTAVRAAGLRSKDQDGRYRLLLAQYKKPNGQLVSSCKELNNSQIEDLLAICEAYGWQMPGKSKGYYQTKRALNTGYASFAQQAAIGHLAGDLGWNEYQLGGMLKRMTGGDVSNVAELGPNQAYKVIEAMKKMFSRQVGKQYNNMQQIKEGMKNNGKR